MTLHSRYEIQQRLGKKAGRQTLLARDKQTEELVVVKLLTFSSDFNWDDLKLFEREAETLQSLSHSAIPRYLDSFEVETPNGKGFALVQNYIEAKSLEEHLKDGRNFSEREVKQIAKSILEILTYLHAQKPPVIHRDIKPSNILLTCGTGKMPIPQAKPMSDKLGGTGKMPMPQDKSISDKLGGTGKMPIPQDKSISCGVGVSPAELTPPLARGAGGDRISELYLIDFGSVQTLATKEGKTVTVVGTYGYMPPEQFGGISVPASDLYSVGATLIALLTNAHPADLPQKDLRIQFEQITSISPDFTRWLKRMIEPSVDRRFKSAKEALQALEKPWLTQSDRITVTHYKSVTTWKLFRYAIVWNICIGAGVGTGYGALYGTAVYPLFGTFFGSLFGLIVGIPLGFFNGLLVAIVTWLYFFPLEDPKAHRRTVSFISTLFGTIVSLVAFSVILAKQSLPADGFLHIVLVLIPSALAGLSMGASSKQIARWYAQQSRQEEDENYDR
ncbi:serine/threonine protein kinase [Microseira wollei]|uniref:Serine/threonine kinase n=1 Tax=Microseira wollei NIES-4236 TaxID=2530354 RepID=A0AAV3XAP2_9CYAN|nr:serine/threonine-protein kinase [Microseira wollei]GET39932.1 serine/threonine kinase [Microseira wollei NIES-4236]